MITGLWSGEPFSYRGKHYQLDNVTFLPRPVQQPRIPIWVAGLWPNRRPFRRAARLDGVVPLKVGPSADLPGALTPDELPAPLTYIQEHRESDAPFDVNASSAIPTDLGRAKDVVDAFAAAGATWLQEWQPTADALPARLRAGPPPR